MLWFYTCKLRVTESCRQLRGLPSEEAKGLPARSRSKCVRLQVATFEAAIAFLLQQGEALDCESLPHQSDGTKGQPGAASSTAAACIHRCCSIDFICCCARCDIVCAATRGEVLRWLCACIGVGSASMTCITRATYGVGKFSMRQTGIGHHLEGS